jgi:hypothetical protein
LIREAVARLKARKIIRESTSEVASLVIIIMQKSKPRFCIDLREMNSKIVADRYTLPRQDAIFNALQGAIYFSLVDANKEYHQFSLSEKSKKLTAFVTEEEFWEFLRILFGLKNAPSYFQRSIDIILSSYR